jgi:putative membrane-bound dehydrogenase-like protein
MKRQIFAFASLAALTAAHSSEFRFGTQTFTVPDGFVVELVAAPPLVERPVSIDFDEQGRLYVTDSSGSNEAVEKQVVERPHRVLRLDAAGADGRFTKSTVFADKMMFPEGAMWLDGSLYVSAPPSIWKLTDTDGDGVSDVRSEWHKGGTLTHCANDLHGPYRGPDGWIYWCKGAFAEQTIERPGQPPLKSKASHIFRARPDGSHLEAVMTGGMDNPVGIVFTPEGERIFSGTFFVHPGGGQRDGLIHAIYGGVYGKAHEVLDNHVRTGELMPILTHLGPAAACGLAACKSPAFGTEYRGNLFTCCFNLHKVTRHALVPDGATYHTTDSDFLVSDSTDFHPTDVLEDADGSLLVVDTGGWYKICCPTSQLSKPDVLGAIYRVRRKDAAPLADPRGLALDWKNATATDLANRLADERPVVRERANAALGKIGAASVPALEAQLGKSTRAEVRRETVWALTRIDAPAARESTRTALTDADESVRHAAAHSASVWRDAGAAGKLTGMLHAESPALRRIAAEALGRLGDKSAAPALLAAAAHDNDRVLEHSLIYALIEIADVDATRAGLASKDIHARRAALIALDQMPGGGLRAEDVAPLLSAGQPSIREAARWIAGRHVEWGGSLAGWLRENITASKLSPDDAAQLLSGLAQSPAVRDLITDLASSSQPTAIRALAFRVMSRTGEPPATWLDQLADAIEHGEPTICSLALDTARNFTGAKKPHERLLSALRAIAAKSTTSTDDYLRALQALPGSLGPLDATRFALLRGLLAPASPVIQRRDAASLLRRAQLDDMQLRDLAHTLAECDPSVRGEVVAIFETCTSEPAWRELLAQLSQAADLTMLPGDVLRRVFAKCPAALQTDADALLARLGSDIAKQKTHLDELAATLKSGDIRRGQAVFNAPRIGCVACHAIGYVGGNFGPDLSRIGQIRTERDLLEAIVYPSASFVRSFEPAIVVTKAGAEQMGLLRKDTPDEILLATGPATEAHIPRAEITELRPGTVSPMPPGIEQMLTPQELADLIAFLKATRG